MRKYGHRNNHTEMNETLIDRRRDMLVADHKWKEVARITTIGTTTISLPPCSQLGFFIVGGGGSGHGDFSNARSSGNGGNGGCVNSWIIPINGNIVNITVGKGGASGGSRSGESSSITYNGTTYTSSGGYGGTNNSGNSNTKQINSGIGGSARWGGYPSIDMYNWCSTHTALEIYPDPTVTWGNYGAKGEDGLPNPFDPLDINLYGAGGGAGQNAFNVPSYYYTGPAISGGTNGGGTGGYGANNASTNKGLDATFYGGGGGGASFSSNHAYGQGGAGYQGIVIIYGK